MFTFNAIQHKPDEALQAYNTRYEPLQAGQPKHHH